MMTKKKTKAKAKGSLTVENDKRGKIYKREFEAAPEAEWIDEEPVVHSEDVEEAVETLIKKELIEIIDDEVQIYQKAMKGKHIAELFSGEE